MPKKPSQAHNPEDEPAVRAAHIAGSSVRKAALITASGAILAALLGGLWLWLSKTPPVVEKKKFVGRVSDGSTGKSKRGAKVILEGEGVPPVLYTDSEGIFSFPLNDPNKEVHIRVDATGYEDYDRRIIPSENPGTLEIRLEPLKIASTSSPPNPSISPISKASPPNKDAGSAGREAWGYNWELLRKPYPYNEVRHIAAGPVVARAPLLEILRSLQLDGDRQLATIRDRLVNTIKASPIVTERDYSELKGYPNLDLQFGLFESQWMDLRARVKAKASALGVATPD